MFKRFNANWGLVSCLRKIVKEAGIVLPEPSEGRQKVSGFMGSRGEYRIGDCVICTYAHMGTMQTKVMIVTIL
jgi:hypothetical protein